MYTLSCLATVCVGRSAYLHAHLHLHVCVCVYVYMCVYVCVYSYIYIHIYIYSGGELREAQRCVQDAEHKSPHNLSAYVYGSLLKGTPQPTPPQDLISLTYTISSEHTSPHNLRAYTYGSRLKGAPQPTPAHVCSFFPPHFPNKSSPLLLN